MKLSTLLVALSLLLLKLSPLLLETIESRRVSMMNTILVYLKDRNKTFVYLEFRYTLKIDQNLCQNSMRSYSSWIRVRMKFFQMKGPLDAPRPGLVRLLQELQDRQGPIPHVRRSALFWHSWPYFWYSWPPFRHVWPSVCHAGPNTRRSQALIESRLAPLLLLY